MLKPLFFAASIALFAIKQALIAQYSFGNQWINYGQQYLKLTIDTKGIYRITKEQLDTYGFSTTGQNPKNLQLIFRGVEMAINVVGEADDSFDNGDYLEFFAINNDGTQDIYLYDQPSSKPYSYASLYSDETSYFLTFGPSFGKRMANGPDIPNNIEADSYFLFTKIKNYTTNWSYEVTQGTNFLLANSDYEKSEGLCSKDFSSGSPTTIFNETVLLENIFSTGPYPIFEASFMNRIYNVQTINFNIGAGSQIFSQAIGYVENLKISRNLTSISGNSFSLNISNQDLTGQRNPYSLFYHQTKYPRLPLYLADNEIETKISASDTTHLPLKGVLSAGFGYDITDILNQRKIALSVSQDTVHVYLTGTSVSRKIWLSQNTKSPKAAKLITFTQTPLNQYDYVIITDPRIRTGSESFKTYRETANGGNFKVLIAEVPNIYEEFSNGERNPIAIKRYLSYLNSSEKKIKYLFLVGRSISKPTLLKSQFTNDYVPTFGYPGSDILFSTDISVNSVNITNAIPTGRLVVSTNQEILDYLSKVQIHEIQTDEPWKKNFLGLAGPTYQPEYQSLYNQVNSIRDIAIAGDLQASLDNYPVINKPPSIYNGSIYPKYDVDASFYQKVNDGVGLFLYYGHGLPTETVYQFGFVSKTTPGTGGGAAVGGPANYQNFEKYPLFMGFGCLMADSFASATSASLSQDWVNTPNKGAIAALAQSYYSYEFTDSQLLTHIFENWLGQNNAVNMAIGNILLNGEKSYFQSIPTVDKYYAQSFQQTILVGDPAVKIFNTNSLLLPGTREIGNWDNPNTWTSGRVPLPTSSVIINHDVTVDGAFEVSNIIVNDAQINIPLGKQLKVIPNVLDIKMSKIK
jgi:hypothetical protein